MFPPPPLTEAQGEIVERVAALARERCAPRAARYDADAAFPYENYADLHAAGLHALTGPRDFGGVGADAIAYAHALRAIARAGSATALTFNMHSTVTAFLAALGTPEQKARWLGAIVERGARIGAITSEPSRVSSDRCRETAGKLLGGLRAATLEFQ